MERFPAASRDYIYDVTCDYASLTEQPGSFATEDQLSILYTRYHLAAQYAANRDVLEVACGPGLGLAYLKDKAARVTGGDLDPAHCRAASRSRAGVISRFDAQNLPYADASFDLVVLYEALYYLPDASAFWREARRVLRLGGVLLISTVNCAWPGFSPSPLHTRYFTASELEDALKSARFKVRLLAGFPENTAGALCRAIALLRRWAVRFNLIPPTLKARDGLKRLFYGKLTRLPKAVYENMAPLGILIDIRNCASPQGFRVIYAIATKLP